MLYGPVSSKTSVLLETMTYVGKGLSFCHCFTGFTGFTGFTVLALGRKALVSGLNPRRTTVSVNGNCILARTDR